jgi:hypothetical protein
MKEGDRDMRILRWLAWTVGILFLLGTVLQLVDFWNLYSTPPAGTPANMVEGRLAAQDYRVAIWPIFAVGNLAFAVGFIALVGVGLALAARLERVDPRRIVIPMTFAVAGVLGAVGQLMIIGAAQVTVDLAYCDCGFKNEEVVSQIWGQMLIQGASEWLVSTAAVLAAIGIVGVALALRRRMPAGWDIISWLTAIGLIATVVVQLLEVGGDLGTYLLAIVTGVLVPIWSIWLGASFRDAVGSEPGAEAEGATA